jgi:hypothetical protein
MGVLIDGDTQQPIISTARTLTGLRAQIASRHDDWPALTSTLWAATTVPGLAALAVIGMLMVGALGTVLAIIGLAR